MSRAHPALAACAHIGQGSLVPDFADLAAGYWENYRRATSEDRTVRKSADQTQWAWEAIEELVCREPENAIAALTVLADAAPDDAALAYLGAGPVENLLRDCSSAVVIDRVEGAAARNANFRKALRCAWFDDHVSPAVAKRLRSFGDPY